jgi:hypothetical protein
MERNRVSRRNFFKKTAAISGTAAAVYSWEEQSLLAFQQGQRQGGAPDQGGGMPPMDSESMGAGRGGQVQLPNIPGPVETFKLGGISVSRLIAGHNLIVGQAHSRDLLYTSALLQAYFTDAKIQETFAQYEKNGINVSGARMSTQMLTHVKRYKAAGGKLMWMAGVMVQNDGSGGKDLDMALEMGCTFAYIHGISADGFVKSKNIAAIGKALETFRKAKLVAGVTCHAIEVPMLCEKEGIKPDFYIKTHNEGKYWSAGGPITPDPNWKPTETELAQPEVGAYPGSAANDKTPKATAAFMAKVKVPWIGFKVLGAGAIAPSEAFSYCFKNGCDGLLVGMYDFQVAQDANTVKNLLLNKSKLGRTRGWFDS